MELVDRVQNHIADEASQGNDLATATLNQLIYAGLMGGRARDVLISGLTQLQGYHEQRAAVLKTAGDHRGRKYQIQCRDLCKEAIASMEADTQYTEAMEEA